MGWSGLPYKPSNIKQYFADMISEERYDIIDIAIVHRTELYMAIRDKKEKNTFCFCAMLRYSRNGEFWYKNMDETCGPCMYKCPERILSQLTPIDSEYANNWRKTNWDRVLSRKKRGSFKTGSLVFFKNPIGFTNGTKRQLFIVQNGRRMHVKDRYNNFYVLNKRCLQNNEWEVLYNG